MVDEPRLRRNSPVAGLARSRLSFVQVFGLSISAVAPSAVMVTLPAIVIEESGRMTVAVFAVASALMAAVGYCIGQFAQRMVAVSGLYSYTVKGLGPRAGFASGWSLIIGYGATSMASLLGAASYIASLLGRFGISSSAIRTVVLIVALGFAVLVLTIRGVKLSAQIVLSIECFAILAASVVLVTLFIRSNESGGAGTQAIQPTTMSTNGFALLLAFMAFAGFESAGTIACESQRPFFTIPRVLRWTPVIVGLLYVFAASMQLPAAIGSHTGAQSIVLTIPDSVGVGSSALTILMELGIAASWFGCALGCTTALSRTLFAMGREGVVPSSFGRTNRRFKTPHIALLTAIPLVVAVPAAYLLAGGSSRDLLIGLLALAAHGYVVSYLLLSIATPAFLGRIGELTRPPIVVAVITAASLIAVVVWAAFSPNYTAGGMTTAYFVLMLAGALILLVRVRHAPEILARMGVYDETIESDLLSSYSPWRSR